MNKNTRWQLAFLLFITHGKAALQALACLVVLLVLRQIFRAR